MALSAQQIGGLQVGYRQATKQATGRLQIGYKNGYNSLKGYTQATGRLQPDYTKATKSMDSTIQAMYLGYQAAHEGR